MRACLLIRDLPPYRRDSFVKGLQAVGCEVDHMPHPGAGELLVTWNRYGVFDIEAKRYEKEGGKVIVAENGYLGREWLGKYWYAIANKQHNGGGEWPDGSIDRWESLNIKPVEWKSDGKDIIVLGTRHIGPEGIREPIGWAADVTRKIQKKTKRKVKLRLHPGERTPPVPLDYDFNSAWAVVTWGSGAALKAIMRGVPVFYGYKNWIGRDGGKLLTDDTDIEQRFTGDTSAMFRRLAWAMWTTEEIAMGEPFKWLLK